MGTILQINESPSPLRLPRIIQDIEPHLSASTQNIHSVASRVAFFSPNSPIDKFIPYRTTGTGTMANVPGLTSLIASPIDAVLTGIHLHKTPKGEKEGVREASVRLGLTIPLFFVNALFTVFTKAIHFFLLNRFLFIFGIAATSAELALEAIDYKRSISFANAHYRTFYKSLPKLHKDKIEEIAKGIKLIEKSKDVLKDLYGEAFASQLIALVTRLDHNDVNGKEQLKTIFRALREDVLVKGFDKLRTQYLEIQGCEDESLNSQELIVKKTKLARRIGVRLTKELQENMAPIYAKLHHSDPRIRAEGVQEAGYMMRKVHSQINKKMHINLVGIFAYSLTLIGLSLSLLCVIAGAISINPALPLFFIIAGAIFAITRYILFKGYFEQQGMYLNPSLSVYVPDIIKEIYYNLSPSNRPVSPKRFIELT